MRCYFAADTHLGLQVGDADARERRFVRWLDSIKSDATEIFLLGDIFDFWCEYKTVVPRGFVRTLGKLSEITDSGIPVHFFVGNHDLWLIDYLEKDVGLIVHKRPLETKIGALNFFIAHGDYIDKKRNLLRKMFANPFLQQCFRAIHPRWGVALARYWSRSNRLAEGSVKPFEGESEFFVRFARKYDETHPGTQFVFGHRHTPIQWAIGEHSQLTVLGEWITGGKYAVSNGEQVWLDCRE